VKNWEQAYLRQGNSHRHGGLQWRSTGQWRRSGPRSTPPSLQGKNLANLVAIVLAIAAVLKQADLQTKDPAFANVSKPLRKATLSAAADGIRVCGLGGEATMSGMVDEVIARLTKGCSS